LHGIILPPHEYWETIYHISLFFNTLKNFNPGEYTFEATYSTETLVKRQEINIPIGMWRSNVIEITVLEE